MLQNKALLISQQDEHIADLIGSLILMFSIDMSDGSMDGYFVDGGMRIAYADIFNPVEDRGSYPTQLLAELSDDIRLEVATYAINLVLGLQSV